MSKHYSKKRRLKYVFVALACTASFSLTGLAAACAPEEKNEETEKTTSREDTQLLKNGNFEFFNVPDQKDGEPAPEYLINTPNNWTHGGATSYTMSGIIGTSDAAWGKLTAENLAERLDANNALESSASNYKETHVDFNGMKSSDILYKDSFGAIKYGTISSEADGDETKYYIGEGDGKTEIYYDSSKETYYYDAELTKPVTKETISNPGTHNIFKEEGKDPYYVDENGDKKDIAVDENGDYYLEKDEAKNEYRRPVGHVLMLHNYSNSNHNGVAQNYSSIEIDLPANTSAEVSVWVKTSDLLFSNGKYAKDDQNHGANITVTHTVGTSTLDDFAITSINTEKLLGGEDGDYNGWVEYTVYINACNFAASTISLKLGLGETEHPVEGYAFFDDVTVTKYTDIDDSSYSEGNIKDTIKEHGAYCDLMSDASEKIFVADTFERPTDNGTVKIDRFSKDFHYLLDLASVSDSESGYRPLDLTGAKAGLTVDSDNFVSSKTGDFTKNSSLGDLDSSANSKLPDDLKNLKINGKSGDGIDTSDDLLALVSAGSKFTDTKYADNLNEALSGAADLPNANADSKMLVLFSAKGAAYTASFDVTVDEEDYQIISFWVKTSDMDGGTAATVKITEDGNKNNTANVTLDTTGIVTDIDNDNKDIYDGWVQCFFFVHNDTKKVVNESKPATLHVEFSFGNTAIKGTTVTSYKAGWAALANIQTLSVNEDVFAYTGNGNYTGSLTISEDEKKTTSVFDEISEGQSHMIENGFVDPASYTGVNGGSTKIVNNGVISPFDGRNPAESAGLINKDYADKYKDSDWYKALLGKFGIDTSSPNYSATDAIANWNEVFGSRSVQPLIIVNDNRFGYIQQKSANEENYKNYWYYNDDTDDYEKVGEDDKFDKDTKYYTRQDVINYGFIGENKTVASNGFTTVSVKVKVSAGAIAYIYLIDTSDSAKVLGFNAPSYTYWYDEDGNVLKDKIDEKASLADQRANVLYTLRDDGLFEDKDGHLRANTWNYTKLYNENITYYTQSGSFTVDELVDGVTYYADEACTKEADHYLVTADGVKVYKATDEKYYYIVNGETQKDEVLPFEKQYARYTYEGLSEEYMAKVEDTNGEWVTVNFVIHAGSESKSYRLELWSGERENYFTDGNEVGGSVIFDYSYTSISNDDLMKEYESEIIKAYQRILDSHNLLSGVAASDWNISDYKKYVEENLTEEQLAAALSEYDILNKYTAHYYTFSLYDSANFQPFNKQAAKENATGYDYSVSNFDESLAYLAINDGNERTVFIDYSTIDQSITLDLGSDEEDEEEEETENTDNANVWLLASSIILVVALIFAMIAILIKDGLKKTRRKKVFNKNNYNTNKANRYIRKLGIKKEEIEEVDAKVETNAETNEEVPAEAPEEAEQPAEETVETEQPDEPADTSDNSDSSDSSDSSDGSDGSDDKQE